MHIMAVIVEIRENFQNVAITIYYILIGIWFFGILFFYMFNALEWFSFFTILQLFHINQQELSQTLVEYGILLYSGVFCVKLLD